MDTQVVVATIGMLVLGLVALRRRLAEPAPQRVAVRIIEPEPRRDRR